VIKTGNTRNGSPQGFRFFMPEGFAGGGRRQAAEKRQPAETGCRFSGIAASSVQCKAP